MLPMTAAQLTLVAVTVVQPLPSLIPAVSVISRRSLTPNTGRSLMSLFSPAAELPTRRKLPNDVARDAAEAEATGNAARDAATTTSARDMARKTMDVDAPASRAWLPLRA